jgi:tRNA1Val (adenine37-N6)-methyltransferase
MENFYFKKFVISQKNSAMKVNSDGVLLGAWVSLFNTDNKILDVGCGTGVIALILAQKLIELNPSTNGKIVAIDIDSGSMIDCTENFRNSSYSKILKTQKISFQDFSNSKEHNNSLDLIISNPPYFSDSLKCSDKSKTIARHNDSLSLEDIIICSNKLLKEEGGRMAVILPYEQAQKIQLIAANHESLYTNRILNIKYKEGGQIDRQIVEFIKKRDQKPLVNVEELTIHSKDSEYYYTKEYCKIVEKYYQKELSTIKK